MQNPNKSLKYGSECIKNILFHIFLVFYVILLIFFLEQKPSVWFDEYFWGVAYLHVPTLSTFIHLVGTQGPEVAPLYISILYCLYNTFGLDIETIRFFSVVISILTILFTFNLFKLFFKPSTAFFVTLPSATIPTFLWYSLLLRPHALGFSLSMGSLFFFLSSIIKQKKKFLYYLALICINTLLVLTYYIYVWIVIFEILLIITYKLYNEKRGIFLLVANLLLVVAVLIYLTIFTTPSNLAYSLTLEPYQILSYIFGVIDTEIPYYSSWLTYLGLIINVNELPPLIPMICEAVSKYISLIGNCMCISILLGYFIKGITFLVRKRKTYYEEIEKIFLLGLGFIIPLGFVIFYILTKIPLITIRFLLPAVIIRWGIIASIVIFWKPKYKLIRQIALILFFLFVVNQYFIYRASRPYTAWRECTEYLSPKINDNDILIVGPGDITPIFYYNWKSLCPQKPFPPCITTGSLYLTIDALTYFIKYLPPDKKIWLLCRTEYNTITKIIMEELNRWQIQPFEIKEFPFFEGLACYGFSVKDNLEIAVDKKTDVITHYDVSESFGPIVKQCKSSNFSEMDLFVLSRYDAPFEVLERSTYIQFAFDFMQLDRECWYQVLISPYIHLSPWMSFSCALTFIKNDPEKADEIFKLSKNSNPFFFSIMQPLWLALKEGDYKKVEGESNKLMEYGLWVGHYLNHIAKHQLEQIPCIFPVGCFPYNWETENQIKRLLLKEPNKTKNKLLEYRYEEIVKIMDLRKEIFLKNNTLK